MKKYATIIIAFVAIGGLTAFYFYRKQHPVATLHLPYFGPKKSAGADTVFHTVSDFSFLNQNAEVITKKSVAGKIYVADYFFTTCGSICPVMKKQMNRVYKEFLSDNEVVLLSHTVDPETDSVEVLKEFAGRFNARAEKWMFLTGDKAHLYDVARKGYLLDANEGNGGAEDFIHTQNFALVDKNFHIRGYYDGTDSVSVNKLIKDIRILKEEYLEAQ